MKLTDEQRAELKAQLDKVDPAATQMIVHVHTQRAMLADLEEEKTRTSYYKDVAEQINDELELARAEKDIVRGFVTERDGIIAGMQAELAETKAKLEEAEGKRANGNMILVPADKLAAMQAELAATRKQLAEAQAMSESAAKLLELGIREEGSGFDSPPEPVSQWDYEAGIMVGEIRRQDTAALDAVIAEAVAPYKRDAERLDYLQENCATVHLQFQRGALGFDFVVGGTSATANQSIRAAIDAARAAKEDRHG